MLSVLSKLANAVHAERLQNARMNIKELGFSGHRHKTLTRFASRLAGHTGSRSKPMKSYFVHSQAIEGTLLGGVKKSSSSRFGLRQDAETRATTIREFNPSAKIQILISDQHPEIFPHCKTSTSIGSLCPECKIKLTVQHAKEFKY